MDELDFYNDFYSLHSKLTFRYFYKYIAVITINTTIIIIIVYCNYFYQ